MNPSHNTGLAPTYLGQTSFHNAGSIRADGAHVQINGYTRGWDAGTCLLAVQANAPPGSSGCNQGSFWDPSYRAAYSGQDSAAAFFAINGITPLARNAVVAGFGTRTVLNLGGERQVVATVTLSAALDASAMAAINHSTGPVRVEVDNGFFGYALPAGFSAGGQPVNPVTDDGRTILVDNWTRAVEPNNLAARDAPSGRATSPSLPYWTPGGISPGTGILPNQVGQTNNSPPLRVYHVTVDGNSLAESIYGGFKITDDDVVNAARFVEITGINNKRGKPAWDETNPLGDSIDGRNTITHLMFGGCQNDDGVGIGVCGAMLMGSTGLKRVVVCDNPQTTGPEGATDCVLDTRSVIGWKSTKAQGYVLWIDPRAAGNPRMVIDWNGNVNTAGRIFVGEEHRGITLEPSGSLRATGMMTPGHFAVAGLPDCSNETVGSHIFVVDGRKPGEPPGNGSGVPADCVPSARGSAPKWLSVYDRATITR